MSIRNMIKRTQLLLDQALYESRRVMTNDVLDSSAVNASLLEERILMSASPAALVAETPATPDAGSPSPDDTSSAVFESAAPSSMEDEQRRLDLIAGEILPESATSQEGEQSSTAVTHTLELVFIDGGIENLDQMVSDLQQENDRDENRTLEIVVLDSHRDGIAQITSALLQFDGVDGVHIVSHGGDGGVRLGATVLSLDNVEIYRSAINAWQHSFTDEADVLFYGCNLAATEDGRALMEQISAECDCDVSASEDLTGHESLGGDWDLEYNVGVVQTSVVFTEQLQDNWHGVLATITVTTTDDVVDGDADLSSVTALQLTPGSDGQVSLREAILAAKNGAGADTITFSISDPLVDGAHTINLASALPAVTEELTIDASTDSDFTANGNAPVVVLDGGGAVANGLVFSSTADNSVVRGLLLRNLTTSAIVADTGADGLSIVGNYIGQLRTDGTDHGSGAIGGAAIHVRAANVTIGGVTAADRNVISGATQAILLDGATTTGASVVGNYVGTTATGEGVIGIASDAILVQNGAALNTIGGATASSANVIVGSGRDAIRIEGTSTDDNTVAGNVIGVSASGSVRHGVAGSGVYITGGADRIVVEDNLIAGAGANGVTVNGTSDAIRIEGNTIGTNASGNLDWGTGGDGILIQNGAANAVVGGIVSGDGNTILYSGRTTSGAAGISILDTSTATVRGNSIHSSDGVGIDLGQTVNDGANINDTGDGDTGGNTKLNTPQLTGVSLTDAGTLSIDLDLSAVPLGTYDVDFYASSDRDTGDVEGSRYSFSLSGISSGFVGTINVPVSGLVPGEYVTAVAVDQATGNSSEFSRHAVIVDGDAGGTQPSDLVVTSSAAGGLDLNSGGANNSVLVVDDGNAVFDGLSALTFEVRFSTDSLAAGSTFASYTTDSGDDLFRLRIADNGTDLNFALNGSANSVDVSGFDFSSLANGDDHTISLTWNGATGDWKVFVDGGFVATGSSGATGSIATTSASLVFGQEQDSFLRAFDASEAFHGALHEIRVFGVVRSAGDIAADHESVLPLDTTSLQANWVFDQVTRHGEVFERISGNSARIESVAEAGFTSGDAELRLEVDENAVNGTVVGTVSGMDAERDAFIASLLAADPYLFYSDVTGKFYQLTDVQTDWSAAQTNAQATTLNGVSGQLVTIRSANENELVRDLSLIHDLSVFVGGTDSTVDGEWRWQSGGADADAFWSGGSGGAVLNGAFTNWAPGQPANSAGPNGIRLEDSTGQWHEVDISFGSRRSVIEWDAEAVLTHTGAGSIGDEPFTYSITSQSHNGAFAIDPVTGEIRVADQTKLDFETHPTTHLVTVRVEDGESPARTYDEILEIHLNDLPDSDTAPTGLNAGISLNTDGGNNAYLVADDGGALLGGLDLLTVEVAFSIEESTTNNVLVSYASSSSTDDLLVEVLQDGRLAFAVGGSQVTLSDIDYHALLADGERHSLAVTWDATAGDWTIHIDGEATATGTGLHVGGALGGSAGDGSLIFGIDQDSQGGTFDVSQRFSGTLYDVRLWDAVRSDFDLSLDHARQYSSGGLPSGLVADWQMAAFDVEGRVVDVVGSHLLRVGHANESAFEAGNSVAGLNVDESASAGTSVGFVVPVETDTYHDLVADGRFLGAPTPASVDVYSSGQSLGGWDVTSGSVGLHGPSGQRSPLGGLSVNLNGTSAGTIQQTLATEAGVEYQVVFALSGRWMGGDAVKDLRVTAGATTADFSVSEPNGWAADNKLWAPRAFTFTATSSSTNLQFMSLDAGDSFGPIIADVRAYEVPPAVTHLLNSDPALSYNAGTGKFYRLESAAVQFSTARTQAQAATLHGVSGQLVTVGSEFENELVRGFAQGQGGSLWLGASDAAAEGQWFWLNGDEQGSQFWTGGQFGLPVSPFYENWGAGEPNNSTGVLPAGEDAAAIDESGVWYDQEDMPSNQLGYLVEWDASEVLSSFTYTISDPSANFEISNTGEITVRSGHTLDFDVATSHDVDVTVTDAAGNSHTQTLTVQVNEVGAIDDQYVTNEDSVLTIAAPGLLTNDFGGDSSSVEGDVVMGFDARTDTDSNSTWSGHIGSTNLALAPGVTYTTTPTSAPAGITAAFDFDGTGGATVAALDSFAEVDGTQSGSIELWLRLDSTAPSQTLLDLGSDMDGLTLAYSSGQISISFENGGSSSNAQATAMSAGTWHHVALTVDMDSVPNPTVTVWVDGSSVVARTFPTLSNWAAGPFGLGTVNGTAAGVVNGNFAGEIASFRVHNGVLTSTQINANAAVPGAGPATVTSVDDSGTIGLVSVSSDGSFSYDPNGQFASLTGGQTAVDTFTYTYQNAFGASESAEVSITVTGVGESSVVAPAAVNVVEDSTHSFSAGDVIQVDDGIAADSRVRVTVASANGTLQLASKSGLTVLEGNDQSGRMVVEGLESDVNVALSGLVYTPFADFVGADSLTVTLELVSDLQSRYSFDDLTASDSGGGVAYDGQLAGGADIVTGARGPVLNLDAAGEQLTVASVFDQPASLTVAGWVNLTTAGTQGAEFISIGEDLVLRLDDTIYGTSLWSRTATGWNIVNTGQFLSGTGWRHVAATFDDAASQQVVYIDGVAAASASHVESVAWGSGTSTVIGAHAGGSPFYDLTGQIDEARVYTRALAAAEVAALAAEQTSASSSTAITVTAVNDAPAFHAGSGLVTTDFGSGNDVAESVAIQSDGKLVVAGYASNGADNDFAIARYNVDGSPDLSFGGTGVVIVPVGSGLDQAYSVAIQDDGRILVAGESANGAREFAVVRLLANGALDASYGGGDGIVTSDFGTGSDLGYSLTLQSDGKALVSGVSWNGADYDIVLARYTTSGVLDSSFNGGHVITSVGASDAWSYAVDARPDGRILVGGKATISGNEDFVIARYRADGTLDTTFGGGDGIVTTPVSVNSDSVNSLIALDDGSVLVGGVTNDGSDDNYVIAKYTVEGNLDSSFGTGGLVVSARGNGDRITSVVMAPNGDILIAGTEDNPTQTAILVGRYTAAGVIDTGFGSAGILIEDLSAASNDVAAQILSRDDGSFVVVGTTHNGSDSDFAVLSYTSDGSRITSFGAVDTLNHSPAFVEGGAPVVLEPTLTLSDSELSASGYAGSELVLTRTGGPVSEDQFSASGSLGSLTPAGPLTVGGVSIGTVSVNTGGILQLNFSGVNATETRINQALRQIAYSNSSDTPSASVELTWVFDDGNDGVAQGVGSALQVSGTTDVTIQSVPDMTISAPVSVSLDEDVSTAFDGTDTIVVDPDLPTDTRVQVNLNIASGTLTVTPSGGVSFVGGTNGSGGFVLEGLASEINSVLATLVYDPVSDSSYSTTLNVELSLTADLVGEYQFDGDAQDSSVGVLQDGTTQGTAGFASDTRGQVLQLDGGGHVSIATDFGQTSSATVSGWVQLGGAAPDAVLWNVGGDLELRIASAGGAGVVGRFHDGTQWRETVSSIDIHGDGWHHLAYTVDSASGAQVVYIDGAEVARSTFSGGVSDVSSFSGSLIGSDGSGNTIVGLVDDARIHTRALSAEEVAAMATEVHSTTDSVTVDVNAVNDAPELTNLNGDVLGYTEGDGARVIEQGANAVISDIDSADFDGGTLVVSFTAGSDSAQDVLSVRHVGNAAGQIGVTGSVVSFGGVTIGSLAGGVGGTPLTISFNANSSPLAATMVLQNVTFENTDVVAATPGLRSLSFVMSDGDGVSGTSLTGTAGVNVGSPNNAPIITSGPGGGTYFEGGSGTYFNNGLTIADADSADFAGGRMTVSIASDGESDDRLFVRDGGGVTVSGSVVSYNPGAGSVAVATLSGGAGATPLEITFNAAADSAVVQAVGRQVAFRSVSDMPSSAQRGLRMELTDGDGGTSSPVDRVMNVVPVNDVPELDLDSNDSSGSTVNDFSTTFSEGDGGVLIVDSDATLVDDDHVNLAVVTVVLTNAQESGNKERLSADTTGTSLSANWSSATDTLTISGVGTVGDFLTVLKTVEYDNTSSNPETATGRVITFVANDGTGDSLVARTTVTVSSVNNLPTITSIANQTVNEDTATGPLAFTVGDAETAVSALVVTATSSNQALIPDANITLGGSDANRTVSVLPAANQNGGPATITVSVFDGTQTVQTTFDVAVTPRNDSPTGLPGIVGSAVEDQVLNADTSGIADDDGLGTFSYQWLRNGGIISGAQSVSYTLTDQDVGSQISVSVFYTDGQGNAESITSSQTVAVANVNDSPTTTNSTPLSLSTNEDDPTTPVLISTILSNAGWSDADAAPLSGLAITATDNQGGVWQYSTDGAAWTTVTGVSSTSSLLLSSSTQLRFVPGSDAAVTATLDYRAWDQTTGTASLNSSPRFADTGSNGGATAFDNQTRIVRAVVSEVADAPVIGNLNGDSVAYQEEGPAILIDNSTAATVTDVDSVDFNGGNLTVSVTSGGDAGEDVLSIRNAGTAAGQIGVSGINVTFEGTQIGTFVGGSSGTPLRIDFNANATPLATAALIQNVAYSNTDLTNPTAGVRSISFLLNDGEGGVSTATTAAVNVVRVNDRPVLATPATFTVFEETRTTISGLSVIDVDAGASTIRVQLQVANGVIDVTLAGSATVTSGANGSSDLTIEGTLSEINSTLSAVDYTADTDVTGTAADSLVVSVDDLGNTGTGGSLTDSASVQIDISALNDQPVIGNNGFSVHEGGTISLSSALLSATDVDNADADLQFTVSNVTGGQFELLTAPQIAVTSFLQSHITSGDVRFVHDGSEAAPSYEVSVSDGSLSDGPAAGTISFTNVNDAPVITGLGGDSTSVTNDGVPMFINTGVNASIADPENPTEYDAAVLQVSQSLAETGDRIAIDVSGSVSLSTGMTNGAVVRVSGIDVGVLGNVSDGTFDIQFNSNADASDVDAILNATTFETTSATLGPRSVDFTFNDGDGTANGGVELSTTATAFISVAGAGDGSVSTDEDDTYTFVPTDFDFTGVTGAGLQSIELLSVPADGVLRYNGSVASVGLVISALDLQNGLLTFEPDANENGFNYGSFDFQVNNGRSNVTLLAGEANYYTLTAGALFHTEDILTNPANFGPGGTYASSFSMVGQTTTVDPAYLNQGSVLFNGYVPDGNWTPAELNDLDSWVQNGGVLISTSDSSGYDDVSSHFGLAIGGTATTDWYVDDTSSPIINGPFGSVGPLGTTIKATGAISYFDSASLAAGDLVIARDSGSDEPTIVLRQHGSGWILFTADEGIFRINMSGGGNISTSNDTLTANIFAWAADQVPATTSHTMNIDVLAQNDDPVNNGVLPSTVVVNEDQQSPLDLTGIDLFDPDAAGNALRVTLSTQSGGQLTAIASGGVSISGSGTATLELSGTQTDLNGFFSNPLNVSYTSVLDQNGLAIDRIRVQVTDNGNLGAGGGGQIDLGFIDVDVLAMNDAPVATVPVTQSVVEETPTAVSGFSVSDVDAGAGLLTARLQSINGQLSLTLAAGVSVVGGSNDSDDVTISGTVADLNITLASLIYTANSNVVGTAADQITLTVNDSGNTGAGGPLQDVGFVQINVFNVNDEQVLATNNGISIDEGDLAVIISRSDLEVTDVDNSPGDVVYTLTSVPVNGVLRLNGAALADDDTFTQADINANLLTYDHNDAEVFFDQFSFSVDDGEGLPVTADFDINVNPVNDNNPVIVSNGGLPAVAVSVVENSISVIDVDATDADLPAQTIVYRIAGGTDAAVFDINPVSGQLRFRTAPDFETPTDSGGNNVYEVVVEANDGQGRLAVQSVQVTITDLDEFDVGSLTDSDSAANGVAENSVAGANVGLTAFAADLDGDDSVLYSLDDDAGGVFAIDGVSGVVTLAGAVDREATAAYSIVVRATSSDGSSTTSAFTIAINDVDEFNTTAVTDINSAGEVVAENVPVGTAVGITAFASDADATNNGITYSLDDNAGGLLTIDPNSGVVRTAAAIDYESVGSRLDIIVRATSQDASFTTQAYSITIQDLDEFDVAPIIDADSASNAIQENASVGTAVGVTAFSEDLDSTNSAVSYSLDSNAGGRFTIDATTGVVTSASVLDFESGGSSHDIVVRAVSEDGSFVTTVITVNVNDSDEFDVTPITDADSSPNEVAENVAVGTAVGYTASSVDADGSLNAVSYSLDDDAGGLFRIDAVTGQIQTNASIDFETTGSAVSLVVRATSADSSTTTHGITISINDVNEFSASPVVDTDSTTNQVYENVALGTNVGVSAFSQDLDSTNSSITYSLDDDSGGLFTIDANSGVVATAASIDFEAVGGPQSIVVRADSADGSSSTAVFSIGVIDVNDTPPEILPGQQFFVSEFASNGTNVGFVAASDADSVGSLSNWTISGGNPDGLFSIDSATGQLQIADSTLLNHETSASHTLTLTVSDGVAISNAQAVTVVVTDENDAPVLVASSFDVDEHTDAGTIVDTAVSSDEDAGEVLTYSLLGPPDQAFAIDSVTGTISVADPTLLDFEVRTSLTVTVQVEDSGGLTDSRVLTININDVNERPVDLNFTGGVVNENSPTSTFVATATATDVDAGDVLTYSLANDASGRFRIDASTGVIRVQDGGLLDFETNEQHAIVVRVTDAGGLAYDETLTVTINDINEAPVAYDDQFDARQLEDLFVSANGVSANDIDVDGDRLYVVLVRGPENGQLVLHSDGSFTYTPAGVYSGPDEFQYLVTDGQLNSQVATVQITVLTTVSGDSGNQAVVIEPQTPETEEPTLEVEEEVKESEETEQTDTEQQIVSSAASANGASEAAANDATGVAQSTSREILQRTNSSLFVAVFLEEVPTGEGLDDSSRSSRKDRSDSGERIGRGITQYLFRQVSTDMPFLKATTFDISQSDFIHDTPAETSFIEVVLDRVVVGSSAAVTTSVSVGYVVWLVRGGSLVTSVLSSIPIWQGFDPLPVLDSFEDESGEDAESLESMVS